MRSFTIACFVGCLLAIGSDGAGIDFFNLEDDCKLAIPDTRDNQSIYLVQKRTCKYGGAEWHYTWNNITITLSRDADTQFQFCLTNDWGGNVQTYKVLSNAPTPLFMPKANQSTFDADKNCAISRNINGVQSVQLYVAPDTIYYVHAFTWVIFTGQDIVQPSTGQPGPGGVGDFGVSNRCRLIIPWNKTATDYVKIIEPECVYGGLHWSSTMVNITISFSLENQKKFQMCLAREDLYESLDIYQMLPNTSAKVSIPELSDTAFDVTQHCALSMLIEDIHVVKLMFFPPRTYQKYGLAWKILTGQDILLPRQPSSSSKSRIEPYLFSIIISIIMFLWLP